MTFHGLQKQQIFKQSIEKNWNKKLGRPHEKEPFPANKLLYS